MDLRPFQVRANPGFVILEFFDQDFSAESDLAAMASAAGSDVAVLAVTDTSPSVQVTEITTNNREQLEELGATDTGNPLILAKLVSRAMISYPNADNVAIGFAGHGTGIFAETDAHPNPLVKLVHSLFSSAPQRILPAHDSPAFYSVLLNTDGGMLTNKEMRAMFRYGLHDAGRRGKPIDLIFFDTCLNGMIEVVTEIAEFADCVVGSNNVEPGDGWGYDEWLKRMSTLPPRNGAEWGRQAVEAMEASYAQAQRIVTLSAIHTNSRVVQCFADLVDRADRAGAAGFELLDQARSQAHAFGNGRFDSRDLGDFAARLAQSAASAKSMLIATTAEALSSAVKDAVIDSIPRNRNVSGLAFWFPERRTSFERDVSSYSQLIFDEKTSWSSYLYQYLDR